MCVVGGRGGVGGVWRGGDLCECEWMYLLRVCVPVSVPESECAGM